MRNGGASTLRRAQGERGPLPLMHRVVPYAEDSGRSMHRTSIMRDQRLGRPLAALEGAGSLIAVG